MYLKEFREKLNLTQRELAEILEIAQTAIARYENDKVKPTSTVILKYINELDASPNYLFLGIEPHLLGNIPKLNSSCINLLNDITLVMPQDQLVTKLDNLLIGDLLQRFDKQYSSSLITLLEIIDMDDPVKTRPFLFLYYIFQYIEKDMSDPSNEISDYRQYLSNIIMNYKVITLKNKPLFTDKMKNEIRDFLDIKFTPKECEFLVKNYKNTLEMLEQKMPPSMVKYHRNIFDNTFSNLIENIQSLWSKIRFLFTK